MAYFRCSSGGGGGGGIPSPLDWESNYIAPSSTKTITVSSSKSYFLFVCQHSTGSNIKENFYTIENGALTKLAEPATSVTVSMTSNTNLRIQVTSTATAYGYVLVALS